MTKIARGIAALTVAAAALATGQTVQVRCAQEGSTVYMKTLRVTNCLLQAPHSDGRPVTTGVTQRVENIGKRDVFVEVYDDYFKGPIASVYGDEGALSRTAVTPQLHSQTYVPPVLRQFPLKPGEAVVFKATFQEVIERQARPGASYTVFMSNDIPFRFSNEPVGQAYLLRSAEAGRSGDFPPQSKFEGVVLR